MKLKPVEQYKVDLPEGVSGDWGILKFEAPVSELASFRLAREGRHYIPGHYTRLYHGDKNSAIMTDTPDEVRDHFSAIRQATGRVLINGLGLGAVLKAVLENPEVTHVDVVELSPDVMKLVSPHYTDSRITYHLASAFDIKWPINTRWDVVWHDIWPDICSDNLIEMAKLKRKYSRRTAWQGCWVEMECRRLKRRGW